MAQRIEYHVATTGSADHDGSRERPFRTIMAAACRAMPGDTVTVHAGVYREWVRPPRGGFSDGARIVYRAAPGECVIIKGSEVANSWEEVAAGIWQLVLPNGFFGDYNPYRDIIGGDWFDSMGRVHHTGEVYLNGKSLYEVARPDMLENPEVLPDALDRDFSRYVWHCESDDSVTTIRANFHDFNPNRELVEINVRPACFWPEHTGVDYITVRGFHFRHAATNWAPPTSGQIGAVGPNWSKGWIIEDNHVSESKCCGISLGLARGAGIGEGPLRRLKHGHWYQLEVVFQALQSGWNRDSVGSHIVRNNEVSACEQAGIVGHMGCAFSTISGNHVHGIWRKRQFSGFEIAGIKLHAPIDSILSGNRIHDCRRGLWMDWQVQGTRITGNLVYDNECDLFIEVSHGPCVVDNNLLLSPFSLNLCAQGGAFIHNLLAGTINARGVTRRATPYHQPHATAIAGMTFVFAGDDRYFNNLFAAPASADQVAFGGIPDENDDPASAPPAAPPGQYGLRVYDGHPGSLDEYLAALEGRRRRPDTLLSLGAYYETKQPVYAGGNLYYNQARPFSAENDAVVRGELQHGLRLEEHAGRVYLCFEADDALKQAATVVVDSAMLVAPRIAGAPYENPDGSPIVFNRDYQGQARGSRPCPGPFETLTPGPNRILVWNRADAASG